jgi:hypothetical protein
VLLWISEYGEREGMKRYMVDFDDGGAASAPPPPPAPPAG